MTEIRRIVAIAKTCASSAAKAAWRHHRNARRGRKVAPLCDLISEAPHGVGQWTTKDDVCRRAAFREFGTLGQKAVAG